MEAPEPPQVVAALDGVAAPASKFESRLEGEDRIADAADQLQLVARPLVKPGAHSLLEAVGVGQSRGVVPVGLAVRARVRRRRRRAGRKFADRRYVARLHGVVDETRARPRRKPAQHLQRVAIELYALAFRQRLLN